MSTHNIGFYEDLTKISLNYHQISSNTHLIYSAEIRRKFVQKIISYVRSNHSLPRTCIKPTFLCHTITKRALLYICEQQSHR